MLLAAVFVPILVFGGHYHIFFVFSALLAVLASWEFRNMLAKTRKLPRSFDWLTIVFTLLTYIIGYFGLTGKIHLGYFLLVLFLILAVYLVLFVMLRSLSTHDVGSALLTILYCGGGFLALAYLRNLDLWLVAYALLVAILTDTFAYFIGIKCGRHRLAEAISPKKSVEGALAGLVIGGALAAGFGLIMEVFVMHPIALFFLSFYLSAAGQVGDLVASKFKRDHMIKDFSALLPGHGGILDRFDSWIFIALNLVLIIHIANLVFGIQVI